MLIGQESWKDDIYKGKHRGVYRRLETKVLDRSYSTRQEKTDYKRALLYVMI